MVAMVETEATLTVMVTQETVVPVVMAATSVLAALTATAANKCAASILMNVFQ